MPTILASFRRACPGGRGGTGVVRSQPGSSAARCRHGRAHGGPGAGGAACTAHRRDRTGFACAPVVPQATWRTAPRSRIWPRTTLIGFDRGTALYPAHVGREPPWRREMFALRSDSNMAQLAAMRAGLGIGFCQVPLAAREPTLVRVLPSMALPLECWVVMHGDLRGQSACKALFDALVEGLLVVPGLAPRGGTGLCTHPTGRGLLRSAWLARPSGWRGAWVFRRRDPAVPGATHRAAARSGRRRCRRR